MNVTMPWLSRLALRWHERRTLGPEALLDPDELAVRKRDEGMRVSVVLPALNEATTIGAICRCIRDELIETRVVDELLVVDGGSTDGTEAIAFAAGADVASVDHLVPDVPVVGGKGDSLWRSLATTRGDIVVWIDADIRNFGPHFVTRLIAPFFADPTIDFVKGFYRRPFEHVGRLAPDGGGRVTELTARPLLNALFPELSGFLQPLSGEYAGRREVLERVPFFTGYGVEVGLLVDLLNEVGLDGLAQVDLEERVHRNRSLEQLAPMAYSIAQVLLQRAEEGGRIKAAIDYPSQPLLVPSADGLHAVRPTQLERPPIRLLPGYLDALRAGAAAAALS